MNESNSRALQGVGYVRTSLEKQQAAGDLERQSEKLRKGCLDRGIELLIIYDDVASGAGLDMAKRPGLRDAIKEAVARRLPLVVTEITRITREPQKFVEVQEILKRLKLPFITLDEPELSDANQHLKRVENGKALLGKTSSGTKQAMARKKAEGVPMGSPGDKQAAAEASARARKYRSAEIVEEIADVLAENPTHGMLARKEFAELLNSREIFSGWKREWTATSIVQPRQKAMKELQRRIILQSDIDAEPEGSFKKPSDPVSPQFAAALEGAKTFRKSAPPAPATEPAAEADDAAMRRDPNFARF